jgi:flagellar biosynthetic protein FliP
MTTATDITQGSRRRTVLRFTLHYVEMVVAMFVGMIALAPLWHLVWPGLMEQPTLHVLVMATNMSIGMAAWMRLRKHSWAGIAWMCASMYAAFAVVLPPYWAGLIDAATMEAVGHVLMLPLMFVVMLRRH